MSRIIDELKRTDHKRYLGGLDFFKYIGPGLLVTVGFIDPGNWASNFAAGSEFGYALLWVVTLSTIMLIVLQHNVAHLGIVTGLCLSGKRPRSIVPSGYPVPFWAARCWPPYPLRWRRYWEEPLPCRCFWKFPLPGDLSLLRCLSSLCFFPIHIKR